MNRYRIFISSTIDDLWTERAAVDAELTGTEILECVRVEALPASDEPSRRVCLDEVASADAVVLILSSRYGFIPEANNPEGLSVTHLEYREARRLGKPVFSFLREGVESEPRLLGLIREVSDFDEGVLRKHWDSVSTLKQEARRALLFWVARRAREGPNRGGARHGTGPQLRLPELAEFPVVLEAVSTTHERFQEWSDIVLDHLARECARRRLPMPRIQRSDSEEPLLPTLVLSVRHDADKGTLIATISVPGRKELRSDGGNAPPPIELETAASSQGARSAAQTCLAMLLVAMDDWSHGIDEFIAAVESTASHASAARLLAAAAYISASHHGQRSLDVVKKILNRPVLDGPTVSAGIMCLIAAQLKYEHAGATHALAEVERVELQLLTRALESRVSADVLYNLARRSLKHSRTTALRFYRQLIDVDPSYDARWYFHRDIGLLHYADKRYREAGEHYDRACRIKTNDSELFRFAGDAYYYQGLWAEALLRYDKAIRIEPIETYYLDAKIDFARARLRLGIERDRRFERKRARSYSLSVLGVRAAEAGRERIGHAAFWLAKRICELNLDADKWLALFANRRGAHAEASTHLRAALAVVPEDPSTRLNLAVNLIFENEDHFNEPARVQVRAAIFHGGPETRGRFRLCLVNTETREELCAQFDELFEVVARERKEWVARRREVLRPEVIGDAIHWEWRL